MLNPCSFCNADCCKNYTITASAFDVVRVCRATGKDYEEFVVLHEPRLLSYDPEMVLDTKEGCYLLGFKSHPCVFLRKDNLCSIHDSAPLPCRHYPFTAAGSLNARFCPLVPQIIFRLKGPDMPKSLLLKELEAYKGIVKEWNKKPGKKQDCIPFLLKKAGQMIYPGFPPSQKTLNR